MEGATGVQEKTVDCMDGRTRAEKTERGRERRGRVLTLGLLHYTGLHRCHRLHLCVPSSSISPLCSTRTACAKA